MQSKSTVLTLTALLVAGGLVPLAAAGPIPHDTIPATGPTRGLHEAVDELQKSDPDVEDAVMEHLVGDTQEEAPQGVSILTPREGTGSQPGVPVTITWAVEVIDVTKKLYTVQVKNGDGAWASQPQRYSCTQDEGEEFTLAGTCSQSWNPTTEGTWAIRVLAGNEQICVLAVTCDMVGTYYVDGTAPVVGAVSVAPLAGSKITSTIVEVGAVDVVEAVQLASTTFTASRNGRTVSCTDDTDAVVDCPTLDVSSLLDNPYPSVHVGTVTFCASATDAAGNAATPACASHLVDTTGDPVTETRLVGSVPAWSPNGASIELNFRTVYVAPAHLAGSPVRGAAFTGPGSCSGVTSNTGVARCTVTGTDAVSPLSGVVTVANVRSVPATLTLGWTNLTVTRVGSADTPTDSLHANPGDVYSAAFEVRTTYNGLSAEGAVIDLEGESFEIVPNGLVLVPVMREEVGRVAFTPTALWNGIVGTTDDVSIAWTTVTATIPAASDAFVEIDQAVTFTADVDYTVDLLDAPVVTGDVAFGAGAPTDSCTLHPESAISDGVLTATITCAEVFSGDIPLVLTTTDRDVTALAAPLKVTGVWTTIDVTGLVYDAFVAVGDKVTITGSADYAHGGDVMSASLIEAPDWPAACDGSGTILAGALVANVTCTDVTTASLPWLVTTGNEGVNRLSTAMSTSTIWTKVVVTNLELDDFVNIGDVVTLTADAAYAHGGAVPSATVVFAGGAPADCELLSGAIDAGDLTVTAKCTALNTASIALELEDGAEGVDLLAAPLSLDAIWTNIVVTLATGEGADDSFVAVGDTVTYTATASYAHGGAVPGATLAPADGFPEDCTTLGGITEGDLSLTVTCTGVSPPTGTALAFVVHSATDDVTQLAGPLGFTAVWTNVVLSGARVSDGLVNITDTVTWTATATYAHNGAVVPSGTFALGEAVPDCSIVGGILDGAATVAATCMALSSATGTTIPLVLSAAHQDVTQLSASAAFASNWSELIVAYTVDGERRVMAPDGAPVFTASVHFAHNGAPVQRAIVRISDASDVFTCVTSVTGLCSTEILKETLGSSTFSVSAVSTTLNGRLVSPDVTRMQTDPPTVTYRWTGIAFRNFECFDIDSTLMSCASTFAAGSFVQVCAVAVAADDETETLAGAVIRLGGEELQTDADGRACKEFYSSGPGSQSITARGVSATIGGETVTWGFNHRETIRFG